jgi:DNA primase
LYGLHLSKRAIREEGRAILVEGYFDLAQAVQAGVAPVVACCGTALGEQQVRLLKRFTSKVIVSFDPDPAGAGAADRSGELLLAHGLEVEVAELADGEDPDTCIRNHGVDRYRETLNASRPYLKYVLDREASRRNPTRGGAHQREFLNRMLEVAASVPQAAEREQFGDSIAHRAGILEDVIRREIRRAAARRQTTVDERRVSIGQHPKTFEKGLIWALVRDTDAAMEIIATLEDDDIAGLATQPILTTARSLADWPRDCVFDTLRQRLTAEEEALLTQVGAREFPPAPVVDCGYEIKLLGYRRQQAEVQDAIARCQQLGTRSAYEELDVLLQKKRDLSAKLESRRS